MFFVRALTRGFGRFRLTSAVSGGEKESKMASKIYQQVSKDRYEIISNRYKQFQENLANPQAEVIRVFDALNEKQIRELELIRGVSQELQLKKEEDIKKAAQAASLAEEEAKKAEEEAKKAEEEKQAAEEEKQAAGEQKDAEK